jgi:hypothetical protein
VTLIEADRDAAEIGSAHLRDVIRNPAAGRKPPSTNPSTNPYTKPPQTH